MSNRREQRVVTLLSNVEGPLRELPCCGWSRLEVDKTSIAGEEGGIQLPVPDI